ncbi:MAG: glutamate 5-kinase, partial [Pseudomonadales bacterium]
MRNQLKKPGRWVVKIGSALLTNDGLGLDTVAIADWVEQLAALKQRGYDIVLVSSGSVAEGLVRLGWTKRPKELSQLQAAAAVGQMGLVQAYEQEFQKFDLNTAQILLTHDDLSNRTRYLNARNTINTLIDVNAIPVINENDTVVTDE